MFTPTGKFGGRWIKSSGSLSTSMTLVDTWTTSETPNGVSQATGTFTILQNGLWLLVANVIGTAASSTLEAHIGTSTTVRWSADGPRAAAANNKSSLTAVKRLKLNDTFGLYVAAAAAAPGDVAGGFNLSAVWLGA